MQSKQEKKVVNISSDTSTKKNQRSLPTASGQGKVYSTCANDCIKSRSFQPALLRIRKNFFVLFEQHPVI